jgi:HK97 family phage major capsid protein
MDPKDEKQMEVFKSAMGTFFDDAMKEKLAPYIGEVAAQTTKEIVEKLRKERALYGEDLTRLTEKQKKDFAEVVKSVLLNVPIDTKANEALIEEQDNRGGFLVSREVANAILRIAASVGVVLSQSQKWELKTDELGIPNYTGAFLTGEYLGVDAPGIVQGMAFGQAALIAKKWQLAFVIGNDLLADASVNLADWLLALGGEALANMIDYQAFVGTGSPFVGLLNDSKVPNYPLPSGETGFASLDPVTDCSQIIAQLEESVLDGAAFYMHRTVWAAVRAAKTSQGIPILPLAGLASPAVLANSPTGGGPKPVGEIMGFPVFTVRHLPKLSDTAVSKKFAVFGNLKATAFGDKGEMRVEQYTSGNFGKEIALSDQRGIVYKHRHAFVNVLPAAFVTVETAAS